MPTGAPEFSNVPPHRRIWFDRGCEAFKRSYPTLAQEIQWDRFYICPLCRNAFSELTLTAAVDKKHRLTDEHVPTRGAGGHKMLLTCGGCNWSAGSAMDSHVRREAAGIDFLKGNLRDVEAELETDSGRLAIRLDASGSSLRAVGVQKATNPASREGVEAAFKKATVGEGWQNFRFKIQLPRYSQSRASTSWLRSAYLAFFSALGYRFILRSEMNVVWERIKNPELPQPSVFRVTRPEEAEPTLARIDSPEVFKSYAMFYRHQVVLLPQYNDHTLYERLASHPHTQVTLNGLQYPWPTNGPLFLHDFINDSPDG